MLCIHSIIAQMHWMTCIWITYGLHATCFAYLTIDWVTERHALREALASKNNPFPLFYFNSFTKLVYMWIVSMHNSIYIKVKQNKCFWEDYSLLSKTLETSQSYEDGNKSWGGWTGWIKKTAPLIVVPILTLKSFKMKYLSPILCQSG